MFGDGTKRTLNIRTKTRSVAIPAIQMGDSWIENVTLASGVTRPQEFAALLTLRTPNPDGPNAGGPAYLHYSPRENLYFAPRRFDHVVGLDVAEDGSILTVADLEELRGKQIAERQTFLIENAAPVAVSADDIEAAAAAS